MPDVRVAIANIPTVINATKQIMFTVQLSNHTSSINTIDAGTSQEKLIAPICWKNSAR